MLLFFLSCHRQKSARQVRGEGRITPSATRLLCDANCVRYTESQDGDAFREGNVDFITAVVDDDKGVGREGHAVNEKRGAHAAPESLEFRWS